VAVTTVSTTTDLKKVESAGKRRDTVSVLTLYVLFLMAIPSRYVFGPLGGAGAPSTILGVILFINYLLKWLHPGSSYGSFKQPLKLAGLGLFCAFIAAYVTGSLHKLQATPQNGADRSLILISAWFGVLLLTADGISNLDRLRTLIRRMVLGASLMALLGITQFFTGLNLAKYIVIPGLTTNVPFTDLTTRGSFVRPAATAIHPLEFGFVLAVILPFAIHQAKYAPARLKRRRWLQVGLIALALPMTVSRSAILGFIIAMIVILPTWPRRERWQALGVVVLGAGVIVFMIPGMFKTFRGLFLAIGTESSTASRTSAYASAVPLVAKHLWFGTGFGTFLSNVYFYTDNQYLNSLIELGVVGVIALVAIFIVGWITARRARALAADPETRHLAQCMAAACAVAMVGFATFDTLYFPMAVGVTFLTLGCTAALYRLERQRVDRSLLPI
jgi:O-antigen ligase